MVLERGETEGGSGNAHRGSDQWLYVVSGSGSATIGRGRHALKAGTLLLIERCVEHEIRNSGRTPLKTLNLYVPPAYSASGRPLPRGRP
jgi:mannose-6-phosphate isomerase-like protein (cupin superfamily)